MKVSRTSVELYYAMHCKPSIPEHYWFSALTARGTCQNWYWYCPINDFFLPSTGIQVGPDYYALMKLRYSMLW